MTCCIDTDIGTGHEVIAYLYFADIQNREVIVGEEILSDFDVVSVVAEER